MTGHDIIVAFQGVGVFSGLGSVGIYILHVNESEPTLLSWLWNLAPSWLKHPMAKPAFLFTRP